MGRGGDESAEGLGKIKLLGANMKQDFTVLKTMWFSKTHGESHADRLETFYAPQAKAYDRFRKNFLWGREPLLAASAARLKDRRDVVWVDLGGGTGENVQMMDEYFPVKDFKSIYVVDLCHSLCEEAKEKVQTKKWNNVQVIEMDACKFKLPHHEKATLITFSYSLSMIPPFHEAVDRAVTYLADDGLFGVCDFYVSGKYDLPLRQMSWSRRFFWRSIFDMDNIDIGPERRNYLDCKMDREWEFNGQGSIPYVPYLRVPWYVWIGRKHSKKAHKVLARAQAPPLFPPTFLYTMSWEDPDVDATVMNVNDDDVCLTLTSGGCNSLNLLLHGAKEVYSIDCNPAQSALLELKSIAIRNLDFDQVWSMFGEGKIENMVELYKKYLAPFMTQNSIDFWNKKLYYFERGLYYSGGMGKVCWMIQYIISLTSFAKIREDILNAPTIEEQRSLWDQMWFVRFVKDGNSSLISAITQITNVLIFNRFTLWFGGGVPSKQSDLIRKDGYTIPVYLTRTIDGVARYSHLRTENYFYYNCLKGNYLKENCPSYLRRENFDRLKAGLLDRLHIQNGRFNDELAARQYTKVILMDHVDWLDEQDALKMIRLLSKQVCVGGRVIFRSASLCPPYVKLLEEHDFSVSCVKRADQPDGYFMDRVNMYNSFYLAVRT